MSGAEGGPGKRAGHKASTAPRSDPYFAMACSGPTSVHGPARTVSQAPSGQN